MKITLVNSDQIGIAASFFCGLHCALTPILFLYQVEIFSLDKGVFLSWQSLNYLFLMISFFAISRSIKNSSKPIVKISMFITWFFLCSLLLNEQFELFSIPEFYTYSVLASICGLHFYNLKYCRCDNENCCIQEKK